MWPEIERNNGIGIKFNKEFWNNWGPSKMFYFNQEIFDDSKKIKSIYCMYLPHSEIKFDESEIAMGLHYECGEFGEHTVLFSYKEIPNIEHIKIWDYCVFEDMDTDNLEYINLHNFRVLEKQGKITEKEVYQNFLENYIIEDRFDVKIFRTLSENIIRAYLENNSTVNYEDAYLMFLQNLCQRIYGYSNNGELIEKIADCCIKKREEFDETILEIMNKTQIDKSESNIMKKKYEETLKILEYMKKENDLDSIFQSCRELFLQNVVQYQIIEQDDLEYDFDKKTVIKSGKKIRVNKPIYGILIKDENQKPIFKERTIEKSYDD